jgi:elongation factor G
MKVYDTSDIRNIAVVGHGDSGKTSLVSALLYTSGMVNRLGKIEEGNTVTDYDADEIERQITLSSSPCFLEWDKKKINIIDTPGYGAFIYDARIALNVVDSAMLVVCGVSGVEVQTEKTWDYAKEYGLPVVITVNKLDRERASFERALDNLVETFGREVVPVQIPMGEEKDFVGVVDLIKMKAFKYETDGSGKHEEIDVPDDYKSEADEKRNALIEMIAEGDEALMEKYFEKGDLDESEIIEGLKSAMLGRRIFPVAAAASTRNIGSHPILRIVNDFLPSPADVEVKGKSPDNEDVVREAKASDPYSFYIYKTIADPFAGKISFIRLYTGTIKSDSSYRNESIGRDERFGPLVLLQGKEHHKVPEVRAGDMAAVAKLKETTTGQTFADPSSAIVYPVVKAPEPAISFALEPLSKGDEEKITTALARLAEEDPTLRVDRDADTRELILSGTGQLHIEVTLGKMKRKFGVDVKLHPPQVPYRETIRKAVEAQGRYKKQTGGRGQYGDCQIKMEPLPKGEDFEFVDDIFGGAIPRNFIPAVEKGIQEARRKGFLAGYPVVDFRVTLHDGSYHDVDSSEMAFKIAGSMAFKACMEKGSPTILEPVMNVEVVAPEECMGDLMGDLNSRRGKVQGMESKSGKSVIKSQVPMAEMLNYAPTLNSITGGRGNYVMEFSHYEEVPAQIQEKIIAQSKKEEE